MLVEALDDLVTPADDNLSPDGASQQAAASYEQVLARVSRWPLKDHGWGSLDDGVENVFRRGRQAMKGRGPGAGQTSSTSGASRLLDRIDTRRKEHQREALALGRRLYAEKPSTLRQRLGRLWNAAA